MAKVFDATLNSIIDEYVSDWAQFLAHRCGVPPGNEIVLDTDLSSTLQADRLFQINGNPPTAIHLELEATGRLGIPEELLSYNIAARAVAKVPVHSVLMLLRPKATATDLSGYLELPDGNGQPYITFRYTVIRVWQESLQSFLAAGPGIKPLALLTNEAAADLPKAFDQFQKRLKADKLSDNVERTLLGSTFVLCGLRYNETQIEDLYRNLSMTLEDSTTYQLILRRGEASGEQKIILLQGNQRFGAATPAIEATVRAITDSARLERIAARLLTATDWNDLLATP